MNTKIYNSPPRLARGSLATWLLALAALGIDHTPALATEARADSGYIVQFHRPDGAATPTPRTLSHHVRPLSGQQWRIKASAAQIEQWQDQGLIAHAEPDRRVTPQSIPADPLYFNQWNLAPTSSHYGSANLQPAWQLQTGDGDTVIAVIDTGFILGHQDLEARWLPGYDFVASPTNSADGDGRDADPSDPGDWVSAEDVAAQRYGPDCMVQDSTWHGTAVAGILAASSNNNTGISGGTWAGKILPVRALGKCGGRLSDLVDAIRWSAGLFVPGAPQNPHPADIINLSVGMQGHCSRAEQRAIDDAVAAGSLVVVAAGNGGHDLSQTDASPASCQNVTVVAAVDAYGKRAPYSNYGPMVHLGAPGGIHGFGVLTSFDSGQQGPHYDSHYAYITGTSMAAPHVSATLALLRAHFPESSAEQLRQRLLGNLRSFAQAGCDGCGSGLLDARRALSGQSDDSINPPQGGAPSSTGGGGGGSMPSLWLLGILGHGWWRLRRTRQLAKIPQRRQ